MKSSTVLTSLSVLLLSTVGANAITLKPFVGASMGLSGLRYSDSMKDDAHVLEIALPEDFFTFGIEAGARFGGYNEIYNGGLTFSVDKTTYSSAEHIFTDDRKASIDLFNMALTYDNYIRISGDKASRIDLVLGAGVGTVTYHINYATSTDDETRWSFAPALKVGLDFELTSHFTLSATTRLFIPTRSNYDIDSSYIVGGAVKYVF